MLIDCIDRLPFIDGDLLDAVLAFYKAEIAQDIYETDDDDDEEHVADDKLTLLEVQLEEIEKQRQSEKDAIFAQSIADAQLDDMALIRELIEEEEQARDDHEFAQRLDERRTARQIPAVVDEQLPSYQEAVASADKAPLSKLGGLYLGKKAMVAFHPSNKERELEPEPEFEEQLYTECTICGDRKQYHEVVAMPCNHQYCRPCLFELFNESFKDESLFPPRCCKQPVDPTNAALLIPGILRKKFQEKKVEFDTPGNDRIYCFNQSCNVFIVKPTSFTANTVECLVCGTRTCVYCKEEKHEKECREDEDMKSALALAKSQGWRQCGRCLNMVELRTGCFHITCRCGSSFCYVCGVPWKHCRCPQWDEARLLERAEYIAERAGDHGEAGIARAREILIDRHNCSHDYWQGCDGGRCDECGDHLPNFLYRCITCRVEFCRRCRRNRLR